MGKWRAIVPILLALIIAGGGSYFVYRWLQQQKPQVDVVERPEVKTTAVPIVVASVDIPWGAKLIKEMLKMQPFPAEAIPQGHFLDTEALIGRVTIAPLKANVPVLESTLAPETVEAGGMQVIIREGNRGIAVAGNKVLGLSGLINPGNRIDVLLTTTDPKTKDTVTKIVMEDLLVLATGTQLRKNAKGEPSPVDVYSLEVTPDQAEKITLAASKGKLNFALRNYADQDIVLTQGEKLENLLAAYRGDEPVMVAEAILPPTPEAVEAPEEPPEISEAVEKEEPCPPCEEKQAKKVVKRPVKRIQKKPEPKVEVEIINGTDRKVRKYNL